MAMQKPKTHPVLLILGAILLAASVVFNNLNTHSLKDISVNASAKISQKFNVARRALTTATIVPGETDRTMYYNLFEREKIGVYVFTNDSLVFWNNAQIPFERDTGIFKAGAGLVKLTQGYYLYSKIQTQKRVAIALCLVKPLFDLQNNYLKNNFTAWTAIPRDVDISLEDRAGYNVYADGIRLFSLSGSDELYTQEWVANLCWMLFMLGLAFLLLALLKTFSSGVGTGTFVVYMAIVLLLRIGMLYFNWPAFFYKSLLYDLSVFGDARSFAGFYLGDILINSALVLFATIAMHLQLKKDQGKTARIFGIAGLALLCVFIAAQFNGTVKSLVSNSTLNFDFLSIFNIRIPAFIGLASLVLYALALFIAVNKLSVFFGTGAVGFLSFILVMIGACLAQFLLFNQSVFENCWPLLFSVFVFAFAKLNYSKFSLGLGFQILLMSVITSVLLNFYINQSQKQNLERLSSDLGERHDAILENEFAGIPARIAADEKLQVLLSFLPNGKKEIEQLLRQKYFSEYFNRYNVEFSLFDNNCNPMLTLNQPVLMNEGFFDDRIANDGEQSSVPGLYFIKNYRNNSVYVGKIGIGDKKLYVFMEPKQFEEVGSFPDLLLDQSQQKQEVFKNFSYAIYRSGQNTSRYGAFNYPFFVIDSVALARSNPGYTHYYFHNGEYTQVISQKRKTFADQFTFNSYIFLFFSIISFVCYFIYAVAFTRQLQSSSLTRRIQTIIIVLLLLVMSAVGITSGNLVSGQFETDNKKQLLEKTGIILSEMATQFKPEDFFDESQKEIVNLKLNEYAHLFNTVISVFDKNGYLFNTSQPRFYKLGLAAALANPRAFWNLRQNQSSAEGVTESAGTLDYFSLYTPLYNSRQELIGFVNLPYFAKKSDLVNELSGTISALINVYVILFVISILAGLILSGYITKPLRLIKQQISHVSLGKQNEKIVWESNDEIGGLVSEYNEMLRKLEHSAGLLAQSERESAWREMAKQVAHEIKNPLTPMKLNIQYLQHLAKNNPGDFKEKFSKTSAGIIEQIDALAVIASEFSNFAKLPALQLQTINLVEIINNSVMIFENQKNNPIRNLISDKEIQVKGDKDQCLRVFNNILKNAEQAVDGIDSPAIFIRAEQKGEKRIISISDNGYGIADELKPKIFSPNFTTKTTGSGLGLAMVKNIMQGFGGRIWFESEAGKGTVFFLEFVSGEDPIT